MLSPDRAPAVTRRTTGPPPVRDMPVSATLAASEAMAARRDLGLPVLPLAFGEAGLPVHLALRAAAAAVCANAGLTVPPPQAGFCVYPDFEPWRDHLRDRHHVTTSADLVRLLLHRYDAATLPGSAFGEPPAALRLRLATALLYGDTPDQQEAALAAPQPTTLPWIAAALTRLSQILTDLANPAPRAFGR